MVGFMNDAAWQITLDTGYVTFFSRTRNTLWTKGETSGNRLAVRQIFTDCDDDTVLVKVDREGDGNVCHTGAAELLLHGSELAGVGNREPGTGSRERESEETRDEAETGDSKRLARTGHRAALRARGVSAADQLALLLSLHRRSRDRVHADPRAGNGALRRRRRDRRRAHGLRLDPRARDRTPRAAAADAGRQPGLLEGELRQGALGAGGAGRLAVQDREGLRRQAHRHRAGARHQALLRAAGRERRRRVLLGRHRSEAAGAGRRDCRSDRDRIHAARQPPADPRHGARVEHPAHRQSVGHGR